MTSESGARPRAEYAERLQRRRDALQRSDRADRRFAMARLALAFALLGVAAASLWFHAIPAWWLAAPVAVFAAVAAQHNLALESVKRLRAAIAFYEEGLLRLDNRWAELPYRWADDLADQGHLYARDLDLFGQGSLFHLLDTARTRAGQETLARWLTDPADRSEILARQAAILELRDRIDSRERLGGVGRGPSSDQLRSLVAWGGAPPAFRTRLFERAAVATSLSLLPAALAAWMFGGAAWLWFDVSLAAAAALGWFGHSKVSGVIAAAERQRDELLAIREVLDELNRHDLSAGKLAGFRAALSGTGLSTERIGDLDALLNLQRVKRLDLPAALILFWKWHLLLAPMSFVFLTTHIAMRVEAWRAQHARALPVWAQVAGEFDALLALAGYAYEHPDDPLPDIVDSGPVFEGVDLCHPLIPASRAVPNTVELDASTPLLIVSGSNMSGKSTLLRTVGANAVLALAGAPVRATRLRLSVLTLGATLHVHDSIQDGASRFQVEVDRLRAIFDRANDGQRVLVLLDEFLHGTNAHDRAIAAASLLRAFAARGCIGLITTHDLALTDIASRMSPLARNVHFRDGLVDQEMSFDYRMYSGPVTSGNALAVLLKAGLTIDELWTPSS